VLNGLKERLLAPDVVAEAIRAYAEEMNRLNRERRSSGDAWRAELVKLD
jgi:site-specific DNA recombinase